MAVVKECTIFFDKDDYQLRRKPHKISPIAHLVCDGEGIGTLELGDYGFNLYNTVKVVPVHGSITGDLHVIISKFNRPKIAKNILYSIAINAIYNFVCENRLDGNIYIVRVSNMAAPMENNEKDPCGLESYIDACYAYIKNTYKEEENNAQMKFEDLDNEDSEYYTQMNLDSNLDKILDNIDKDVWIGKESILSIVLSDIKESVDEDIMRDLELAEEYEEEDPYNEFEEEDNPAYCKPDDPDKELNARYV